MAKRKEPGAPSKGNALNAKQQVFVREYLIDLNATAAYKRAGYKGTGRCAENAASQLLGNHGVKKAIEQAMAERAKRTEITADDVLKRWWDIANADANELIEMRRTCCRHCHGEGFQYQRTRGEMDAAKAGRENLVAQSSKDPNALAPPPFDPMGGIGFDARKAPHPDCPECFGEGVVAPFIKDTRGLSEGARGLYAGVKVTKDGIEFKMNDRIAALVNVAKHLGMFVTKHEHSGGEGGAIPIQIIEVVRPSSRHSEDGVLHGEDDTAA